MKKNDSISIPAIVKIGNGALGCLGPTLKEGELTEVVLYFGNGLIDLFGAKVMDSMRSAGITVLEYQELDDNSPNIPVEREYQII